MDMRTGYARLSRGSSGMRVTHPFGGSISPGRVHSRDNMGGPISRKAARSAAPGLWSAAWPPIFAPAPPRNRHTPALVGAGFGDKAGVQFLYRPRRREEAGVEWWSS